MYRTDKEAHIAIDQQLQHISSNRKQSIRPEEKDMALNYGVLQFIELRSNPKTNIKHEGFEDSQKRYDDLRELKTTVSKRCYKLSDNSIYTVLPNDYLKLISTTSSILYKRKGLTSTDKTLYDQVEYIKYIPFLDDLTNEEKYPNFSIVIGSTTYSRSDIIPNTVFKNKDSKFTIISTFLDYINSVNTSKLYWERYDSIYQPNCFILVSNTSNTFTVSYTGMTQTLTSKTNTLQYYYFSNEIKPNQLVSSEHKNNMLENYYNDKNRFKNPISVLENNRLIVFHNNTFVINNATITYIKRPKLINYITNSMCEITLSREIVDLAVQRLKAYIKDDGYNILARENTINE